MESRSNIRSRLSIFVMLISLSLIEMAISSLLLENLSKVQGWSATFAEDSEGYLLVTRYFLGEKIPDGFQTLLRYRLFSPLIPFVVSLVGKALPLSSAFFLLNSLLWIITTYLFYLFTQRLLKSDDLAFASSIIFTTSLPLMVWGLPIMVDMGAYFFITLILLLDQRLRGFTGAVIIGLVTGLGILTKPTLAAALLYLIISHTGMREGRRALIIAGVSLPVVFIVYYSLGLEFKDFLSYSLSRHQGIFYVLNSLFSCFHVSLFLALMSWRELRKNYRFYISFLLAVLFFYLPFVHNPRLLFIIYPAVIPLISVGADTLSQGLSHRFRWDKRFLFYIIISLSVIISNCLTIFYLYVTRILSLRSTENLLEILRRIF